MKKVVLIILINLLIGCQSQTKKENIERIKSKEALTNKQTTDSFPVFLDSFSYDNVDGEKFSFKEVKGKVLLLDFWSTNCAPCIREHPTVVGLEKKINNTDFQVVTISIDHDKEKWKKFVKKNNWQGINIHIYSHSNPKDPLHQMIFKPIEYKGKTHYTATIPTYYLVDKKTSIFKLNSINDNKLEARINELLSN